MKNKVEEYLLNNGYELDVVLERYWFMYKEGEYRAVNTFPLDVIFETPLSFVEGMHEHFLTLAKQNKIF